MNMVSNCCGVRLCKRTRKPGQGCNTASAGWFVGWLRRHPKRDIACRLDSEENYVAQTFERFWQATTLTQTRRIHDACCCIAILTCKSEWSHPGYTASICTTKRSHVTRDWRSRGTTGRKTRPKAVRCGRHFRRCFPMSASRDWLTCSSTAGSSQEKLSVFVLRNGAMYVKSIA